MSETAKTEPITDAEGNHVGFLRISADSELYFSVDAPYRGKHLASRAVYDLTRRTPFLHARIGKDEETARHVLEHAGFMIIEETDSELFYEHRPQTTVNDRGYTSPEGTKVIYLAGGCFWGLEKAFRDLPGVADTCTGYANGTLENPTYEDVCRNDTGHRETVRVTYDPAVLPLATILEAFFLCIDPTQENGQGEDIGSQYQTGVYTRNNNDYETVLAYFEQEKKKYPVFHVECRPLLSFYEAEAYHQDYLMHHPSGYCHISRREMDAVKALAEKGKRQ